MFCHTYFNELYAKINWDQEYKSDVRLFTTFVISWKYFFFSRVIYYFYHKNLTYMKKSPVNWEEFRKCWEVVLFLEDIWLSLNVCWMTSWLTKNCREQKGRELPCLLWTLLWPTAKMLLGRLAVFFRTTDRLPGHPRLHCASCPKVEVQICLVSLIHCLPRTSHWSSLNP